MSLEAMRHDPLANAIPIVGLFGQECGVPFEEMDLWDLWIGAGDVFARETLLRHYMPYAKTVAASYFARRIHDDIEFAEYMQLASVGLIEALERFNPGFGVQFKTFAARRMHGAILNGLETLTEKNQQIAVQKKFRQERLQSLKEQSEASCGCPEIVKEEVSAVALFRYLAEVGIGVAVGILLSDTGMVEVTAEREAESSFSPEVSYFRKSELSNLQRVLNEALVFLGKQEQMVIRYHYLQGVSFGEIGEMLGVTKGRISQIHRQGLKRLRGILDARQSCDVAW